LGLLLAAAVVAGVLVVPDALRATATTSVAGPIARGRRTNVNMPLQPPPLLRRVTLQPPPPPPPPPPRRSLSILVFSTIVDPQKHAGRVAAIRKSWASRRLVRNWLVDVTFVHRLKQTAETDGADVITLPATGVSPVAELKWALERVRERQSPEAAAAASQWALKCDDITFVVIDSLLRYLDALDERCDGATRALAAGKRLRANSGEVFLSGGAGVALNRVAIDTILAQWDATCTPLFAKHVWWRGAAPDVGFAQCLRALGIDPVVTRDARGAERFHAWSPLRLVRGAYDPWFTDYSAKAGEQIRSGPDGPFAPAAPSAHGATAPTLSCCAAGSVTFHYVEAPLAQFIDGVLADPAAWRVKSASVRFDAWPQHVGGHDRRPNLRRHPEDAHVWPLLLDVLAAPPDITGGLCAAGGW
jgi:hypothetical protein